MNIRSLRFRMTAWYAGLLAGSLILFGASVYAGLYQYLDSSLKKNLSEQSHSIGDKLLVDVGQRGEQYVVDETNEHYAPEISGRFIRITRSDGSILYQSSAPRDKTFDPYEIQPAKRDMNQEFFRQENVGTQLVLVHSFPFYTRDHKSYLIEVAASYQPLQSVLHGLLLNLALGMPLIVAGAVGGGYWLMRRALQPVDDITQQARRITSRNLSERLTVPNTGDEIERLSVSLNRMIARLDDAFQHINRFSADVSHELRTPLTILRGELEGIVRQSVNAELLEMIGSALEETDRLTRIIDHLLEISRLDAGETCCDRVRLDLGILAASTAEQMHLLAEEKSIALVCDLARDVEVEVDPARFRQVIANLLDNAIKYTPEDGCVKLTVYGSGKRGIVEIADNGVGISPKALPHIFERFYRADQARSRRSGGTGLGLSIVKAICAAHEAEIIVFSEEGVGSRFRVELALANGHNSPSVTRAESPRQTIAHKAAPIAGARSL
jgi:heavy metal sensor kinase